MAVRVLLVDDSPLARELLRAVLSRFDDIEIAGEAGDGMRARTLVAQLKPDVVTMDVLMPMMGGLETIERIMAENPTPIVVVANTQSDSSRLAIEALEKGALEVFPKPRSGFGEEQCRQLANAIRRAARVSLAKSGAGRSAPRAAAVPVPRPRLARVEYVGIVGSTGAPHVLKSLIAALPASYPCGVAVVQHTAFGFTEALAHWLDSRAGVRVAVAADGARLRAGEVVLAPDDRHLEVDAGGRLHLRSGPPIDGHRPSGTTLLASLAQAHGARAAGIVLSGMGRDGADGLAAVEAAGGIAAVESPEQAVVAGMPRQALQAARTAISAAGPALAALLAQLGRQGKQ
jgi:two-component system, chemotaxis family, protein-glutamate methylesterase/glutaminase